MLRPAIFWSSEERKGVGMPEITTDAMLWISVRFRIVTERGIHCSFDVIDCCGL